MDNANFLHRIVFGIVQNVWILFYFQMELALTLEKILDLLAHGLGVVNVREMQV